MRGQTLLGVAFSEAPYFENAPILGLYPTQNVGAINNIKVTTQIVTRVFYDQDLNTLYMCLHVDQLLLELSS
jgi:hypothetical protein